MGELLRRTPAVRLHIAYQDLVSYGCARSSYLCFEELYLDASVFTFEVVAISTRCGKQDVVSPWTRSNSFVGLGPLQDRTTSLIASTARASKKPPGLVHRTDLLGPEYGFGNDFVLLDETYLGAYGRVRHQYQISEPTAGASAPQRLTPNPADADSLTLTPSC